MNPHCRHFEKKGPKCAQQLALPSASTVHVSQALNAMRPVSLLMQMACTVCHELKSCKQAVSFLRHEATNWTLCKHQQETDHVQHPCKL